MWYTAILALVLIAFSGISYGLLARAIRAATDASLAGTTREFAAAFSNHPSNAAGDRGVLLDFRYSNRALLVMTPTGQIVASSRTGLMAGERRRVSALVRTGMDGFSTIRGGPEDDGIRLFITPINVLGQPYRVVAAESLQEQADRLESAAHAVLIGIPLALLVAAAGGYVMARKSLAPVTQMSIQAREISAETLNERIAVGNEHDELGFLAITLNNLLERLERAFDLQRRFMADASHELRTPMAIIQGEADVALSRGDRSSGEYQESIRVIQGAARKLTRIVQNLFLLARSDSGTYPMNRSRFYLDDLLHECVRAMRSVAAMKQVALNCQSPPDLMISADEELIHRLVLNLVDNAVKFANTRGHVAVHAEQSNGNYVIRVIDDGPGIPPEHQPRVFERFFRGDRVHGPRDAAPVSPGGGGLGLPIARWIAEFHRGSLDLERSDSTGTVFRIVLPAEPEIRPAAATTQTSTGLTR